MIIGLCGTAKSGKDTAATYLEKFFPGQTTRVQIAAPFKAYCREVFDWTLEHTDGKLKDVEDIRYPLDPPKGGHHYLTPRIALQVLGGEVAEATFPSVYATAAARKAQALASSDHLVIVTDGRYLRDIQALKDVGGKVLQLHRGDRGLIGSASSHKSETQCRTPEFQALVDHHIYNDGSKEAFREEIYRWVQTLTS